MKSRLYLPNEKPVSTIIYASELFIGNGKCSTWNIYNLKYMLKHVFQINTKGV